MSIGSKVKKYREGKGLSQRTLAESIDASQSVISSIESDKSIPGSLMLGKIAEKLGVDINELLADEKNFVQNNYDRATVHSQVTINNHFPEDMMKMLLSNQDKITTLLEMQNKLMERLLDR